MKCELKPIGANNAYTFHMHAKNRYVYNVLFAVVVLRIYLLEAHANYQGYYFN